MPRIDHALGDDGQVVGPVAAVGHAHGAHVDLHGEDRRLAQQLGYPPLAQLRRGGVGVDENGPGHAEGVDESSHCVVKVDVTYHAHSPAKVQRD